MSGSSEAWRERYPAHVVRYVDERDAGERDLRAYLSGEWGGQYLGQFNRLLDDESRDLWTRFKHAFPDHPDAPGLGCRHTVNLDDWPSPITMAEVRYGAFPYASFCLECASYLEDLRDSWPPLCDVCQGPAFDARQRAFLSFQHALVLHLCQHCAARLGSPQFERAWFAHDYSEYKIIFAPFLVRRVDGSTPPAEQPSLAAVPVDFGVLVRP